MLFYLPDENIRQFSRSELLKYKTDEEIRQVVKSEVKKLEDAKNPPYYMSANECRDYLQINNAVLKRYCEEGLLKEYYFGRKPLYSSDQVLALEGKLNQNELVFIKDCVLYLSINPSIIYRLCKEGLLKKYCKKGKMAVRKDDLLNLLKQYPTSFTNSKSVKTKL